MFFIKKIYYINGDFMRLDVELVRRGLLETRTKAKESIKEGIDFPKAWNVDINTNWKPIIGAIE